MDTNSTDGSQSSLVDQNGYPLYDPTAYVPKWHQNMELATICVMNGLSLLIIIARTWIRIKKMNRYKADDKWMVAAGILLVFPYTVGQIGANVYGSGLYFTNIPEADRKPFWEFGWSYFGYFIISSLIKVSYVASLLSITEAYKRIFLLTMWALTVPHDFYRFRRTLYVLCACIMILGIIEACLWLFTCVPFQSNFIYEIESEYCLDLDVPRYCWAAFSIIFDLIILYIPFQLLRITKLAQHERRVLMLIFGAYLLGTMTCAVGILGIWSDRFSSTVDSSYSETLFIMLNDIEIFMYTVGASLPVLSPYFISWCAPERSPITSSTSSVQSAKMFQVPRPPPPQTSQIPQDAPYMDITERSMSIGTSSLGGEDRMYENQFFENIELEDGLKPEYGFGLRQAKVLSVQKIVGMSKRTTWIDVVRSPGSPTPEPRMHYPDQHMQSIDLQR